MFVLALLVVITKGLINDDPSDYEYGDPSDYGDDEEIDVHFINSGESFFVDKGTTIRLPCYINTFPENFVIMWKKVDESHSGNPHQYLAIGESMIIMEKRFSVEISKVGSNMGSTLFIGLANEGDDGQYVCQLVSSDKGELIHKVIVRVPPTIEKIPKNGLIEVFKFLGCVLLAPLALRCNL